MTTYEFHIEPLFAETLQATTERFNALGAQGWHAVGKYSSHHMLFERAVGDSRNHFQLQPNHTVKAVGDIVSIDA